MFKYLNRWRTACGQQNHLVDTEASIPFAMGLQLRDLDASATAGFFRESAQDPVQQYTLGKEASIRVWIVRAGTSSSRENGRRRTSIEGRRPTVGNSALERTSTIYHRTLSLGRHSSLSDASAPAAAAAAAGARRLGRPGSHRVHLIVCLIQQGYVCLNENIVINTHRCGYGNAFGRVCLSVSVCLWCSYSNFRKPWPNNFTFWHVSTFS